MLRHCNRQDRILFFSAFFLILFQCHAHCIKLWIPKFIWKHTVSCVEEKKWDWESYWGRMKERPTEFKMVKNEESGTRQGQETIAAFVFCLKSMLIDCSIILIWCCCYAKVGLDDARYSWTNWLRWRVHGFLLGVKMIYVSIFPTLASRPGISH